MRLTRNRGKWNEFSFLKLFLTEEWVDSAIELEMATELDKKRRRAEKRLPKIKEFWIFFARLMLELVLASPAGHTISKSYARLIIILEREMKEYRYDALKSSLMFRHNFFASSMDHNLDVITKHVTLGRVVALDETILATESNEALDENMVVYIPGKPHPKGLLSRALCGKFKRSNCVFFMYGLHKYTGYTCDVVSCSVQLLSKLESVSNQIHITLIDGAYPCKALLRPTGYQGTSIHICSVTKAGLSSESNNLAHACKAFLPRNKHSTLIQQSTGLVASCHNSSGKEIVLVTDAFPSEYLRVHPTVPQSSLQSTIQDRCGVLADRCSRHRRSFAVAKIPGPSSSRGHSINGRTDQALVWI